MWIGGVFVLALSVSAAAADMEAGAAAGTAANTGARAVAYTGARAAAGTAMNGAHSAEFQTSDRCVACHNGMVNSKGDEFSIGLDWRVSLMANSSRDPYWQ